MTIVSSSHDVQYDLRPAKQVERRILVDALQRLAQAGLPIRDYKYTGFGSVYFVDFLIFHKLLGISKMASIEYDPSLEKRVRYNRPFECVEIIIGPSTQVIPTLSRDIKHFLWLDYDRPINSEIINDICLAGIQLSPGSIFLVTVDAEPPSKSSEDPDTSKKYFEREAKDYLGRHDITDFKKTNLYRVSKKVILNALNEGLTGRPEVKYYPLFSFLYADGHKMLSLGGIIGSEDDRRKINNMNLEGASYFRMDTNAEPYEIIVPKLTKKERHLFDAAMPCAVGWQPDDFSIPNEQVEAYCEIYRFLPAYAELLL